MTTNLASLDEPRTRALLIPNVIAIASGKGGVGKTWLASSLSHALATQGRRVLLFDGDLGLANVDIQLGLAPAKDLGGVLSGRYTLADATTTVAACGFDVIAGHSGSGNLASLPAGRLAELTNGLATLAQSYDRVVLDLGAGIERTVRQLALSAGLCLVVTNEEPTALTDAYAFIKLALAQNPQAALRVVVNQASSQTEGERTYGTLRKACESFLKVAPPLAAVVPRDKLVRDAIRNQAPILTRHPGSLAAEAIVALAKSLI